jgi:hypothetical protein
LPRRRSRWLMTWLGNNRLPSSPSQRPRNCSPIMITRYLFNASIVRLSLNTYHACICSSSRWTSALLVAEACGRRVISFCLSCSTLTVTETAGDAGTVTDDLPVVEALFIPLMRPNGNGVYVADWGIVPSRVLLRRCITCVHASLP